MSFSKKWDKLQELEFTTFRYPRKDTDWYVGEIVQVYFKSRSPKLREKLGEARIINKEYRELSPMFAIGGEYDVGAQLVTDSEAIPDGFTSREDMVKYMEKQYGKNYISLFNKLTLRWI
jgi:hypothetical protein